jgi:glycosyltransferase involved in cell wall biosynthesis
VSLVVAGPTVDRSGERLLVHAKTRLGDALDYRGAVHGDAKTTFFHDIDVLLFPTRYANEAQPLVVLEAMAHGVPVIAAARGCIAENINGAGVAVPAESDFVTVAVRIVFDQANDVSQRESSAVAAHYRACELHRAATSELDNVIARIARAEPDERH